MTLFPLMECCELLAIDPKTMRHWLKQATMSLCIHPVDRRRKCLTGAQVQQLAVLHNRTLKTDEASPWASLVAPPCLEVPQEPAHQDPISHMEREKIAGADDEALHQKLSQLEAQVIAQQQQLILLTRDLLRERATRTDHLFFPRDASVQPKTGSEILDRHHENLSFSLFVPKDAVRPLHPAEQRAHFLVLPPLIEYSASGTYVVISSQEGDIPLIPDRLEWFEWFRTLSSFRFVGQSGRLSACRGYRRHRPIRTWYAYRTIHQHDYKHYLGLSEHLTVAHLEAMAAKFQSYVDVF